MRMPTCNSHLKQRLNRHYGQQKMAKEGLSLTCYHPNYCVSMSWDENFYVQWTVISVFIVRRHACVLQGVMDIW